jgi:(Z)-2-((N-methylformamido)methylene)-5-hydroxybutyrolactone dehydrogenase
MATNDMVATAERFPVSADREHLMLIDGDEEILGPVASLIPFKTEAGAVRIANDTVYGLGAAAWTRDLGRAHRMTARLRAGSVWINTYRNLSLMMPFGGFGQSGMGRESGIHALDEYTEVESVYIDLGNQVPFGRPA